MEDLVGNLLSEPREVAFELDRFELADGRLELTGRWFGVQGRRFMRPSLTVRGHDGQTRLLADLADKPWAAENGELWRAAFPCDGELDAEDDAELTVAPDLTVEVRVPDAAGSRRGRRKRNGAARREDGKGDPEPRPSAAPSPAAVAQDRSQAEQTRALSSARAEIATLRKRVEELSSELESERTRFAGQLEEVREASAEALASRDEAIAARRKAIESRDMAQQTIDHALAARGKAKRAAEHALVDREEALAQLDAALAERNEALAQRNEALADRDQVTAQRAEAAESLERAAAELDELARANERLRHQYESAVTTRGATLAIRNAAIESSPDGRRPHRLAVAIAVTSLLVVALAVILILSSH